MNVKPSLVSGGSNDTSQPNSVQKTAAASIQGRAPPASWQPAAAVRTGSRSSRVGDAHQGQPVRWCDLADRLAVLGRQHLGHPLRGSASTADGVQATGDGPDHLVAERLAGDIDDHEPGLQTADREVVDPPDQVLAIAAAAERAEIVFAQQRLS